MDTLEITLLAVTALTLIIAGLHHARLSEVWDLLQSDRTLERNSRIHKEENNELRSALRAEREHVSQLQRQVQLLLGLVPER
ncbi:hypothetical protein GIB23_19340 [Pseudomonas putida]|uniref:hypothetical protein n=1 Tax=Pseudomonas putida TaxID=303 RepID=UPI001A8DBA0B|nr:hypothetical protein [Pseudomonas putida]MBO0369240.1 hypothetical protein [Pseudomonas putida]